MNTMKNWVQTDPDETAADSATWVTNKTHNKYVKSSKELFYVPQVDKHQEAHNKCVNWKKGNYSPPSCSSQYNQLQPNLTFCKHQIVEAEFAACCLKLTENYLHMLSHLDLAKIPYHIHSDTLQGHWGTDRFHRDSSFLSIHRGLQKEEKLQVCSKHGFLTNICFSWSTQCSKDFSYFISPGHLLNKLQSSYVQRLLHITAQCISYTLKIQLLIKREVRKRYGLLK